MHDIVRHAKMTAMVAGWWNITVQYTVQYSTVLKCALMTDDHLLLYCTRTWYKVH
jgi:hypothetical protein